MTDLQIFKNAPHDASAEDLKSYLDGACGGDTTLRARVEALFQAGANAGGFMARPAADAHPAVEMESAPFLEGPGTYIGRYKLLQEIGAGGFGVVYMAEQKEPVKRRVALKIIKIGMDTQQVVARFETERQALAMMDHPNIAKVLDAGATETGRPYFVMELVKGVRITEYCDENQLTTKERLELFIPVCQAIQHAHQKGIIHRDIKPSNVMVTLHDGVPMPKVIDFGIAKATQHELTEKTIFTQYGQFIGTPAYMSPEQAEMSGLDIDTRSDIYSLGVLLYELLVGQTPFDAKEMMKGGIDALRQIIREKEPLRPSTKLNTLQGDVRTTAGKRRQTDVGKLVHQLQGDLDWIVMKCLEKDRTRRYDTTNGLAKDLQRHLANEPVVARPPSVAYKLQKAWHRNKLAFTASVAVALALVAGISVSTWQAVQATKARKAEVKQRVAAQKAEAAALVKQREAEESRAGEAAQRLRAVDQERRARRLAYASDASLIPIELARGNLGRARELLNRQRPLPGQEDMRGWEWRYLWNRCQSDPHEVLLKQDRKVSDLSISSDGRYLVTGSQGRLSLWEAQTLREIHSWPGGYGLFSPTEPWLVFWSKGTPDDPQGPEEGFHLWDLTTQRVVRVFPMKDGFFRGLAFSKDGRVLVVATTGKSSPSPRHFVSWKIPSGEPWQAPTPADYVGPGADSPFALRGDGKVAFHGLGGPRRSTVRAVNLERRQVLWESQPMPDGNWVESLELSRDGNVLAVGTAVSSEDILLLDARTGTLIRRLEGHLAYVRDLLFLSDGTLVSAGADQTIRLWNIRDLEHIPEPRVLRGHGDEVPCLALMPDGKTLISGCKDGHVFRWNTSARADDETLNFSFSNRGSWEFNRDKTAMISINENGQALRWTGSRYEDAKVLFDLGTGFHHGLVLNEGTTIAAGYTNGDLKVWSVSPTRISQTISTTNGPTELVDYVAERNWLVVGHGGSGGTDSIWDLSNEQWVHTTLPRGMKLVSDGSFGLSLDSADTLVMHNLATGLSERLAWKFRSSLGSGLSSLSHDGRYLAAATLWTDEADKSRIRVWDLKERVPVGTYGRFMMTAHSVGFSPDGKRLVAGSAGKEAVKIWDFESRQELLTLSANGGPFSSLQFKDADTLVGNAGGVEHLWRAPSWEEIAAAEAKEKPAPQQP